MRVSGNLNKIAFTLAEILIVLGIIGIVAQITIPTLIANVQETSWKTAAKVAYSKTSQAIEQMKQDEGGSLSYYTTTTLSFKPVFMKYFKIIKDCNNSTCLPPYTTLNGNLADGAFIDDGEFITADGMFYGINNCYRAGVNYDETTLNTSDGCGPNISITVDVNGLNKKPNSYGKDIFMFELVNDNLLPMGSPNTEFSASRYCNKSINSVFQGFGCMINVMQGIPY